VVSFNTSKQKDKKLYKKHFLGQMQNPIKLTQLFRSKLTQYFPGVKLHNNFLLLSASAA
jgi:hypothetical protein